MSDKDRLTKEILEHLRFYEGLGVKWAATPAPSVPRSSAKPAPAPGRPPAHQPPQSAIADRLSQMAARGSTMFDDPEAPDESLEKIRADLGDCRRCKLAPLRTNIVFGSGNPHAELMFVGEAPGADEDEQGLPFVGRAGQLLTKIIEAIEMTRDEVYICNILKCRPPGNRNPEPDEIASCEPFLFRQIAFVKPKVICTLGTFGSQTLLRTKAPISSLRGHFVDYRGAKLMATFHPAYLLRNPNEKRKVWEDMQKIRDYLRSLRNK
jgi:uracil-DNA glycosylase family 4